MVVFPSVVWVIVGLIHPSVTILCFVSIAGICSVLFETRMGCLNEVYPEETQKFIVSVGEMFRLSMIVLLFPKYLWPYTPVWKHFVAVWDHIFKVGESFFFHFHFIFTQTPRPSACD